MSTQFGDRPMYIGGEFTASESGEWMDSVNPATGEVHGRGPAGTPGDVDFDEKWLLYSSRNSTMPLADNEICDMCYGEQCTPDNCQYCFDMKCMT